MRLKVEQQNIRNYLYFILAILIVQLAYGGFMAGLKAAVSAPTWPDINGSFIPSSMSDLSPWAQNLINNPIAIHFIHRSLAYLLIIIVALFYVQSRKIIHHLLFKKCSNVLMVLFLIQVLLGVLTVLNATNKIALVWLGVSHQFVAMIIVLCLVALLFLLKKPARA